VTKKRTPRLDALLDRVERLCENKSALAAELGVSRHHVQYWITSRKYEPGGEITLHLLEWATAEEAKQTSRRSAQTPRRRKARKTHSSYEKRKSGPRKS